ncbi:tRNA (uridine(54)-C5)-methyltransferase TrmA [Spongiibacter sp. KMU-158]|uniref:tRNA/tmRNA (uracil-C(5))-methyltransferase n=1 Tax=Spongiibacter pelagi TaxID=2760804 RepID=A0A927C1N9_9GAMM|nr:tRNA (uridine(54)-C5)-methyltransferase TrmA [Spongiibacter pelagi]MBD2859650.1 tRNA (uridine(54)-C5)-methyltransferase TrmA [Spongiibacter pelagi]
MSFQAIDPSQYELLLAEKSQRITELFADTTSLSPEVFRSPTSHYRMRAEFRIWHQDDDLFYAMFDPAEPKEPVRIDDFPVASEQICSAMPKLLDGLRDAPALRNRLFQVEFLSTLSGELLVTLIYHRKLGPEWQQAATELCEQLDIEIIGRSRGQKVVLQRDYVQEALPVGEQVFHYRQYEGGFSQPNATVNSAMIQWAMARASQAPERDLLELYCGNGNFTIPLAGCCRRVLATEISKTSVKAARENFELNNVHNAEIARMSSEDFTAALQGEREFRRLEGIDLASYDLGTVLVDPPRAGLDEATCELISGFDNIIYISCNPHTLHRDLQQLCKSHALTHFALFDQFPYTEHMECGVFLQRANFATE